MRRRVSYPNLLGSHRATSALPVSLQNHLLWFREEVAASPLNQVRAQEMRKALAMIGLEDYRSASVELRDFISQTIKRAASLNRPGRSIGDFFRRRRIERIDRTVELNLTNSPVIAPFMLFHANGFRRQAALQALTNGLESPFEVVAVFHLANNWVPDVRTEAINALRRTLPMTAKIHVVRAAMHLLPRIIDWKRWSAEEEAAATGLLRRGDVVDYIPTAIAIERLSWNMRLFQALIRTSHFDHHIEALWSSPRVHSAIRARSLDILLRREAQWKTGYRHEWLNKPLGEKRRVAVIERRSVQVDVDPASLLVEALGDRSGSIRCVAAQFFVERAHDLGLPTREIAQTLSQDPSPAVRSRGEYVLRNLPRPDTDTQE